MNNNKNKYNILHIVDTLNVGGAERVVVTLANLFSMKGFNVGVMVLLPGPHPLIDSLDKNINIFLVKRRGRFLYSNYNKISSIMNNYNIIHIHMRQNLRYIWFIKLVKNNNNGKIFFHDHYGDIKTNKSIDIFTKYIIKKSIYIGVSKELCDWAQDSCSIKNIYLLENIIIKEKSASEKQVKSLVNRIILTSNIYPRKNIEFAILIMNSLVKQGKYHLDIIGKKSDPVYFSKLMKLISKYNLQKNITFIEDVKNIQLVLNNYDLGLHTSKSETGPLVLIEYLAHSLPFITFATGEVVNKITKELNFLIINNFEINQWLESINKLLLHDKFELKKNLDAVYLKNFSTLNYFNKCLKIYQKNLF